MIRVFPHMHVMKSELGYCEKNNESFAHEMMWYPERQEYTCIDCGVRTMTIHGKRDLEDGQHGTDIVLTKRLPQTPGAVTYVQRNGRQICRFEEEVMPSE